MTDLEPVELIMTLEEELHIENDEDAGGLTTLMDLCQYLHSRTLLEGTRLNRLSALTTPSRALITSGRAKLIGAMCELAIIYGSASQRDHCILSLLDESPSLHGDSGMPGFRSKRK